MRMATPNDLNTKLEVALEQLRTVKAAVERIEEKLERNYVTVEAFTPVRNIVFGLVGLILTSVVGGLIALVIQK
jgi:hypothetical protein